MARHFRLFLISAALLAFVAATGHLVLSQTPGGAPVAQQFEQLHFRSIGPAITSGRIADLAVYEANPNIYYVGSAHGGLWKTVNNGATFTPEFQDMGLISIGDVTISQSNPDLVWVGTGEANNRQSTPWGDGVYKSTDGGKTFKNMGLRESYHINRIVIDPIDNNIVFVATPGSVFGPGGDRGVYKTTDGGATWKQVLKVDENTGANDLVMDPTNNKILYASTYQRQRSQCCFNGGGPGSGIWKSIDAGETWTRITNGLPKGSLGRIGLDIYRRSPNILYASIEAESLALAGGRGGGGGGGGLGGGVTGGESGLYRSDDAGASWHRVSNVNPRPMYFSQVRVDPNNPDRVYMGGVGLQMTVDGGKTVETNADQSIHSDIHTIWIDPANSNHLMLGDDGGVAVSYDMSHTWIWLPNIPVSTFYHVGFDLAYPFNVCGGEQDNYDWCGPSASRFVAGIRSDEWQTIQGGDGFVSIIDQRDWRIVYTESQDGNMTRHNRVTGESKSIRPNADNTVPPLAQNERALRFNWDTPLVFSPNDPGTLYATAQRVFKSTDRGDTWTAISPDLTTNPNRDEQIIMGLKDSEVRISRNDGISAWPTIISFAESQKQPGLFYAGTDDGVVSVSKDGGKSWQNITDKLPGFPKGAWVSKVAPSRFDAGTVYVTVDAHRLNNFETYIWASNDFGATFRSLNANLKGEAVKTLTEDQRNPDVLYIGTETGIFLTLDRGKSWARLKANLPTVRVDEITLHPRDNALIVATHGRGIWILDHLEPIQEYSAAQAAATDAKLFSIGPALQWKSMQDRNNEFWGHQYFLGENPPFEAVIQYALKKQANDVKLKVTDALGKDVREVTLTGNKLQPGIQTGCWDMRVEPIPASTAAGAAAAGARGGAAAGGAAAGRGARGPVIPGIPQPQPEPGYMPMNPCGGAAGARGGGFGGLGGGGNAGPYVLPGTYNVALMVEGKVIEAKPIKIVADPEIQMTDVQRKRYYDVQMDLHDMQHKAIEFQSALNSLFTQMSDVTSKVKDSAAVPAAVKTQFEAFNKDFDAIRVKFNVPPTALGGGRGGGAGRGAAAGAPGAAPAAAAAANPGAESMGGAATPPAQAAFGGFGGGGRGQDLISQASYVKGQMASFWEMPSDALMKEYSDIKLAFPKAVADANAFLLRAATMGQTLKKYDIALTVPAPIPIPAPTKATPSSKKVPPPGK